MSEIPLMIPSVGDREAEAVAETVKSGWLSHHGSHVGEFEDEFADYVGIGNATTTSSGTDAIRLAVEALGIGPGDEVIVPTTSYIATVTPVVHAGATPRFVDVRRHDFAMDPREVRQAVNEDTKAIIVAHLFGMGARAEDIKTVADDNDLYLIEDAAQALGAKTARGHEVGTVGDVATFSFTGTKILNTGQGGMAVTSNDDLAEEMEHLKHHGTVARVERGYQHDRVGFNFCMTNMQAALGRVQLDRFDEMLQARAEVGQMYWDRLERLFDKDRVGIHYMHPTPADDHAVWWHPVAHFDSGAHRRRAENNLQAEDVAVRRMFYPLPWQEAFDEVRGDVRAETAADLYEDSLVLPCWPEMTEEQVEQVVWAIESV